MECLDAATYAADVRTFASMVDKAYASAPPSLVKPKVIVTDQLNWEPAFFEAFIPLVADVVDVITWHEYPLGPG